jgi:hypothetical protein
VTPGQRDAYELSQLVRRTRSLEAGLRQVESWAPDGMTARAMRFELEGMKRQIAKRRDRIQQTPTEGAQR